MLSAQNLTDLPERIVETSHGAIGVLGEAEVREDGSVLAITGVPLGTLDPASITDYRSAARLLPGLDGAFASVFWDALNRKLVVVTDFLGFQPLYWCRSGNSLLLATETKAFSGGPDFAAWGAFIGCAHTLGDRSLMAGVSRVPAAAVWIVDAETGTLDCRTHWTWPHASKPRKVEDLLDSLRRSVARYGAVGERGTFLLSGGFDSRLLLLLAKQIGLEPRALIISHPDEYWDADGRFARLVAERFDIPYRFARSPRNFYSSPAFLDYVRSADSGIPCMNLFISQVVQYIDDKAVWDGLIPGVTLGSLTYVGGGLKGQVGAWVQQSTGRRWRAARRLFRPDVWHAMLHGLWQDLQDQMEMHPDDEFGVTSFYVANTVRNRYTINPYKVYANRAMPLTPGMDREHWEMAASIPCGARNDDRLYLDLISRHYQDAAAIPFVSGGDLVIRERRQLTLTIGKLAHQLLRQVRRQPRLACLASTSGIGLFHFHQSNLLDPDRLETALDTKFRPAFLEDIERRPYPSDTDALTLMFYWLAWHSLHRGGRPV
jgi:hypothetical protein